MNTLFRLCCALLLSVFFLAGTVQSSSAGDIKVGVINARKVMENCNAGKSAAKEVEKKKKELGETLRKKQEELSALQKEIEKKSSSWSEEKKSEKRIELQKKQRDLAALQDDARLELKQLQEKKITPILKTFEDVVKQVAKKGKYTLVLPTTALLYMDDTVDMSDTVIKEMNKVTK